MNKLFVYGTLQKGRGNDARFYRGKHRLIGKAITCDKFILMDFGGFPGMYSALSLDDAATARNAQPIKGELWECDDNVLASIDQLEGHPYHYKRTPIKVMRFTEGTEPKTGLAIFDCETYIYQGRLHGIECETGSWPRQIKLQPA